MAPHTIGLRKMGSLYFDDSNQVDASKNRHFDRATSLNVPELAVERIGFFSLDRFW
jgi:hypothetical protein